MRKEYKYCQSHPFTSLDTFGNRFTLNKGDNIATWDGETFQYGVHNFALDRKRLRELFQRIYTVEHMERYERIRENAMIAAMQQMIAGLKDVKVSPDMYEIEVIPKNAIWFADRLVEELMESEF